MEEAQRAARSSILRTAVVYTPLFLLSLAGIALVVLNLVREGASGLIITLMLLSLAALLTGYQSSQSLRDLRSSPEVTKGPIARKWSRADFFILRSHYIFVGRSVYKVTPMIFTELEEGDSVSVTHYPHTNTVVSVELEERA